LLWLDTMSIRKVIGAWYISGAKGENPQSPGDCPTPLVSNATLSKNLRRTILPSTGAPPMPFILPLK